MKTALQELIEFIELNIDDNDFIKHQVLEEADKAIIKEKEQIIDAINAWCSDDNILTPEQYYNQTYNKPIL